MEDLQSVDQLNVINISETIERNTESDLRYTKLIDLGSKLVGDNQDINYQMKERDIPWLNPKLIQEGKDFVQRHWFAVFLAHFLSLIIGAALKPGLSVMIRTGLSHKRENSLKRYLSTTLHVQTWYESNYNEVIKDIQKVRRLHTKAVNTFYTVPIPTSDIQLDDYQKKVLEAVKNDVKKVQCPEHVEPHEINTYEPQVPISQLGMVMTQFSFMGFIVLFPKAFGIHDTHGIDGFCHLWAVLGKYIGIEDEFNLGLHQDIQLLWKLFYKISIPGLKESDEATMVFWDAITYGVQQYRPLLSMNSLLLFMIQDIIGIKKGNNLIKLMSWYDMICYQLLHLMVTQFLQWSLIRWIANTDARRAIAAAKKKYLAPKTT